MHRRDVILAGLAPAKGAAHTPVQVQKLFFLIDRSVAHLIGGPFFDFVPFDYGPFDRAVYDELEGLARDHLVDISLNNNWRTYRLTSKGQERGDQQLAGLNPGAKSYIERASQFVRALSFSELVSAIYKAYPEMRANSVFREPA